VKLSDMLNTSDSKLDNELLTTEEVAAYLHIAPQTLRQWRWLGQGPSGIKVGRRVLYRRSAVEAWIAEQAASQGV
jgi:excisionase family DNA binding protein